MNMRFIKYSIVLIILSFFMQTIFLLQNNNEFQKKFSHDDEYVVKIKNDLKISDDYINFIGKINGTKMKFTYYLKEDEEIDIDNISYKNEYVVTLDNVQKLENKYSNPSSFDYKKYMSTKKVLLGVTIDEVKEIRSSNSIIGSLNEIRKELIIKNINEYPNIGEYINALVFGYNDIDDEIYQTYVNLSLVHVFAISGTHITIVALFLRYILSYLNITSKTIDKFLIVILWIYSIISGFSSSVIRAVMMVTLKTIYKDKGLLEIFTYTLIMNLLINPFSIFSVGFKLTYIITFILIIFSKKINQIDNKILQALCIQFIINLFIYPITNHLNYSVNIMSYLLNIILIPLIIIILLPFSFILTIFHINIIEDCYQIIIKFIENTCHSFDSFTRVVGNMGAIISAIYIVVSILIVFIFLKYKIMCKNLIYTLLTIQLIVFFNFNIFGSVNIVDVGQGDGIYIQLPYNKGNIIVDIGTEKSTNELIQYLNYCGEDSVDLLFITHMHDDHYGDIETFMKDMKVRELVVSNFNSNFDNLNPSKVSGGDVIEYKDFKFEILAPLHSDENLNNQSLVFKIDLGGEKWLFMGDSEMKVEEELINTYGKKLDIDNLKVAHHGSNTSSSKEFLEITSPTKGYISVGEGNMYNHPSKETISNLSDEGIIIRRTDKEGLIKEKFL